MSFCAENTRGDVHRMEMAAGVGEISAEERLGEG